MAEDPDKPPGRRPSYKNFKNPPTSINAVPVATLPQKSIVSFLKQNVQKPQIVEESIPKDSSSNNNTKSLTLSFTKIALVLISQLPVRAAAHPISHLLLHNRAEHHGQHESHSHISTPSLWINITLSAILVILGGIFAGLTLGLMGQDEVYLHVIKQSGDPLERKAAGKVLALLRRGKHWVLVTLLLCNVITNESLPIVLDRYLGGGWPAIVSSTIAIVLFGEIIPQSVSVRYGLGIGAAFAPFVLLLMYIMYPVAYPIALLLDYTLGEDHGTMYKRAGLKTLVTLHKTMGVERLNDDEVTIISAVLDLKDKPVEAVMTPIEGVFTMSSDRILDEETIEEILNAGFNRIPIHVPGQPSNFVGMLLVRTLITYDPEDAFPISSFPLATLPETGPDTSCLNILNYFQEGKSHMIVVSTTPGAAEGAVGVLTLEDVIEELIGEEIIDESDVYVDVRRAIKRESPGPIKSLPLRNTYTPRNSMGYDNVYHALLAQSLPVDGTTVRPKLNPLNMASNPKKTSNVKVTIKPAPGTPERRQLDGDTNSMEDCESLMGAGTKMQTLLSHETLQVPIEKQNQETLSSDRLYDTPLYDGHGNDSKESLLGYTKTTSLKSSELNGGHSLGSDRSSNHNYPDSPMQKLTPEFQSYHSGIIESVINVQGVSKTIIEVEDVESSKSYLGNGYSSRSNSSHRLVPMDGGGSDSNNVHEMSIVSSVSARSSHNHWGHKSGSKDNYRNSSPDSKPLLNSTNEP